MSSIRQLLNTKTPEVDAEAPTPLVPRVLEARFSIKSLVSRFGETLCVRAPYSPKLHGAVA